MKATASIVFHTGKVYTVNERQPWATAIAVKNESIVYVGDDEGALELVGPDTRVVDLAGKMLLPGFLSFPYSEPWPVLYWEW